MTNDKCNWCKKEMDQNWKYCPNCGKDKKSAPEEKSGSLFGDPVAKVEWGK